MKKFRFIKLRILAAIALMKGDYQRIADQYGIVVNTLVEATVRSSTTRREAIAARMSAYFGVVSTPNPFVLTWKDKMNGNCYLSTDGDDETFRELKSLDLSL